MSLCCPCGSNLVNGCCPTCQPAQAIYQGECPDPGTLTPGRYLSVLDYKFCERRLTNAPGFLTANVNGSGNYSLAFTNIPQVQLQDYQATANQVFGSLIVMGSDYRWRALQGPASLGLFLQTDANGEIFFGSPPAATVPDPLAINDLNVANTATINDLTTNGTLTLNNVAAGTVVNLLGLDVSNEVVLQSLASGIAGTMFYENNTSPGVTAPNKLKVGGQYLVIGNRLFDSGANLISVTTSESITVNVAGKYLIGWLGQVRIGNPPPGSGGTNGKAGISLVINGVVVNVGNSRSDGEVLNSLALTSLCVAGLEVRSLAANDVIQLQLAATVAVGTYEVRLFALKFAD